MTILERIKNTAREKKNISITTLEQTLGYSNGSLAKAKDIPSSRIMDIANFLDVTVDYLMTGNEPQFSVEMANVDAELIMLNKEFKEYAIKLSELPKDKYQCIATLIDLLRKE